MAFNRLNYDDDTFVTKLNESIGPGAYCLQKPRIDCGDCTFYAPSVNLNMFNDGMCEKDLIDVDSELIGITRNSSRCPSRKYLPQDEPFCKVKKGTKNCDFLTAEPTLISNPKATNKETTVNRWEWMCQDPQRKALISFDYNINNRLITKDNFRACKPNPMDQSGLLPPACNKFIKYDWSSRYNNVANTIPNTALGYCDNINKL